MYQFVKDSFQAIVIYESKFKSFGIGRYFADYHPTQKTQHKLYFIS